MAGRPLAIVLVAGCSFVHGGSDTSGSQPDGSTTTGPDARHADAAKPIDAKPDGPPTGSLTVTVSANLRTDINLTTEGVIDWAHWGDGGATAFDHMNGGTSISNLMAPPAASFNGAPLTSSWNNGTPVSSASQNDNGVAVNQGSSMTFTVAAGTTPHTLRLYCGVQQAAARLDLTLSDNSATTPAQTLTSTNATENVQYTIVFNAASNGQTLTVSWTDTHDYAQNQAFAALLSATLY